MICPVGATPFAELVKGFTYSLEEFEEFEELVAFETLLEVLAGFELDDEAVAALFPLLECLFPLAQLRLP